MPTNAAPPESDTRRDVHRCVARVRVARAEVLARDRRRRAHQPDRRPRDEREELRVGDRERRLRRRALRQRADERQHAARRRCSSRCPECRSAGRTGTATRMMAQSGPQAAAARERHDPAAAATACTARTTATSPDAIAVPIAAPAVPNAGIGPSPRIRMTLSTMFSTVIAMPSTHRRARVAGRAQRAAQHEEHQHAAAEHEHDAQERQRLAPSPPARRSRESSSDGASEVAERRHACRATMPIAVRNAW